MKFPENLESHRITWLQAMERLVELEPPALPGDTDDRAFWQHELAAMRVMYADLDKQKATFAAILGAAGEAEPRIRETCNQGVGCETAGVCFAEAVGEPDRCGLPVVHTEGSALPKTNLLGYEAGSTAILTALLAARVPYLKPPGDPEYRPFGLVCDPSITTKELFDKIAALVRPVPPSVAEFVLQERAQLLAEAVRCDDCATVTHSLVQGEQPRWCCACGAKLKSTASGVLPNVP